MEIKNERVLAYQKAKIIDHADLKAVSGGLQMTGSPSTMASGGSGANADMQVDYNVDW